MIPRIAAPYNFVPVNKKVFIPDWASNISHDMPFSDGESGIIELKITAHSPVFVRNGHTKEEAGKETSFSKINNDYFIPATTIKGTIRSVLEIMSFGKINYYNNDYFAYRNFDNPCYRNYMVGIQCGWLRKNASGKLFLSARGVPERVSHDLIRKDFPSFKPYSKEEKWTVRNKQESLEKNHLYPDFHGGKLVCTGTMNGKRHEYVFPDEPVEDEIMLSDEVIKSFLTVHKPTPLFKTYWLPELEAGKSIPVFYTKKKTGEIHSIGLSYMYRYPYLKDVKSCIYQEYKENEIDLAEAIFGTKENKGLKGRVQFCSAKMTNPKIINKLDTIPGVLGEPKASYYPLYLKQTESPYKTYDKVDCEIAGRKRYRIHGNGTKELPQGNGNKDVKCQFKPLPEKSEFRTQIYVHNLRPVELGAILSAITFHNTNGVFHNIGLAKSFGYGKVSFEITGLKHLSHSIEEYLKQFELKMNSFLRPNEKMWNETDEIKKLLQIASEHSGDDILMMSLGEYKYYRKNFDLLQEENSGQVKMIEP